MPKHASAHVSSGAAAERHDRREYAPDSAESFLTEGNVAFYDCGDYRATFNATFESAVGAYNEKQRKAGHAGRGYGDDYYQHQMDSAQQKPIYEMVVGVGDWETCGVTDETFDRDKWRAMRRDNDPASADYVREHMATGDKRKRYEEAVAMLTDMGEKFAAVGRANDEGKLAEAVASDAQGTPVGPGQALPSTFRVVGVFMHVDEPCGAPNLHIAFYPVANMKDKRGPDLQASMTQALTQAGYPKGSTGEAYQMTPVYRDIKARVVEPVMKNHGYAIEDKGNHGRKHMENRKYVAMKEAERLEQKQARIAEETKVADEALSAKWDEYDSLQEKIDSVDEREDAAQQSERDARRAWSDARDERRANERARDVANILTDGYEPPEGVRLLTRSEMSPDVRFAWDDYNMKSKGYRVGHTDEEHMDYAQNRLDELLADEADDWVSTKDGLLLIDVPEDAEGMDEIDDADDPEEAWEWVRDAHTRKVTDRLDLAREAGIDPYQPYVGIDEQRSELEEREADVEREKADIEPTRRALKEQKQAADERDKHLDDREQAVRDGAAENQRIAAKNAATKAANDRRKEELDEREDKADKRDASLDERETKVSAREAKVADAEADADGIRERAEKDAEDTRERADAYARIRVKDADKAYSEAGDPVDRLRRNPLVLVTSMLERGALFAERRMGMPGAADSLRKVSGWLTRQAEKHDGLLHALANGIGDALREIREVEGTVPDAPSPEAVEREARLRRGVPVAPASASAWAAANEGYVSPIEIEDRPSGSDGIELE